MQRAPPSQESVQRSTTFVRVPIAIRTSSDVTSTRPGRYMRRRDAVIFFTVARPLSELACANLVVVKFAILELGKTETEVQSIIMSLG